MTDGLNINIEEFKRMSVKEQNTVLYENLEIIRRKIEVYDRNLRQHEENDWKHQRIMYIALIILAGGYGASKFIPMIL